MFFLKYGNDKVQENARKVFDGMNACPEHASDIEWSVLKNKCIACHYEDGDYSESYGIALFWLGKNENRDDNFCIVRQWEDTTGHGCQCGGNLEFLDGIVNLFTIGLNKRESMELRLQKYRNDIVDND